MLSQSLGKYVVGDASPGNLRYVHGHLHSMRLNVVDPHHSAMLLGDATNARQANPATAGFEREEKFGDSILDLIADAWSVVRDADDDVPHFLALPLAYEANFAIVRKMIQCVADQLDHRLCKHAAIRRNWNGRFIDISFDRNPPGVDVGHCLAQRLFDDFACIETVFVELSSSGETDESRDSFIQRMAGVHDVLGFSFRDAVDISEFRDQLG